MIKIGLQIRTYILITIGYFLILIEMLNKYLQCFGPDTFLCQILLANQWNIII